MTRRFRLVATTLAGVLLFTTPARFAAAQEGVVTQKDLDRAIAAQVGSEASQRQAITSLLGRSDVRDWAKGQGVDLLRAESAVKTLKGDELQRLSAMATTAN